MNFLNNKQIKEAISFLKKGEIIILPTDTIYGISAIVNEKTKSKINKIKNSSKDKPLIILVRNFKQAKLFVDLNNDIKRILRSKNPTTIIYKKKNLSEKYAIRMVKRKDLKKILKFSGPIYSTSVNKSGENFLTKYEDFINFSEIIKRVFYIDDLNNNPSMIIDLINNTTQR